MKEIYKLSISISAAIGFTVLLISGMAMIRSVRMFINDNQEGVFWENYLKSFFMNFHYSIYLFPIALVLFILFYVLPIQRKQTQP